MPKGFAKVKAITLLSFLPPWVGMKRLLDISFDKKFPGNTTHASLLKCFFFLSYKDFEHLEAEFSQWFKTVLRHMFYLYEEKKYFPCFPLFFHIPFFATSHFLFYLL